VTASDLPADAEDYQRMMSMVTGFWVTQIVRAAALYNLAEHLAAGTSTPEAVAEVHPGHDEGQRRASRRRF
jgi:hypothetical protein